MLLLSEPTQARTLSEFFTGKSPQAVAEKSSQKAKQTEFLQRIRRSDPHKRSIEKAVFNGQNELGLVLSRDVSMASIPPLTKALLTQMAKDFPGQDLTVLAYAPTSPPMKVGTAHLDARTRTMTYQPARR